MKKICTKLAKSVWTRILGVRGRAPSAAANTATPTAAEAPSTKLAASSLLPPEFDEPAYGLINNPALADAYFKRLQQTVYRHLAQQRSAHNAGAGAAPYFWEAGRLAPGRAYFYVKPRNEVGWLFERSGLGWVVSRCEKIVGQDLFLRQHEPWDLAALYEPLQRRGYCRVASEQTGGDLISFAVYEQMITAAMGSMAGEAEVPQTGSYASLPKFDLPL